MCIRDSVETVVDDEVVVVVVCFDPAASTAESVTGAVLSADETHPEIATANTKPSAATKALEFVPQTMSATLFHMVLRTNLARSAVFFIVIPIPARTEPLARHVQPVC